MIEEVLGHETHLRQHPMSGERSIGHRGYLGDQKSQTPAFREIYLLYIMLHTHYTTFLASTQDRLQRGCPKKVGDVGAGSPRPYKT